MSLDVTRTNVSDYDVTWGSYAIGGVDQVDPTGMKILKKPIKVGSIGDVKLGDRIIGLDGTIKVQAREVDLVAAKALTAWSAQAGSASPGTAAVSLPLIPAAFHADLYDYAQALKLHPTFMGADTSRDLNLLKAVPHIAYLGDRDGVKDDVMLIEFEFYPLRTGSNSLASTPPIVNYGSIG